LKTPRWSKPALLAAATALCLASACGARTPLDDYDAGAPVDADIVDAPRDEGPAMDAPPDQYTACVPVSPSEGVCNTLLLSGPRVAVACAPGMPPAPSGGTVADGTYVMVSSNFYGTPCIQDQERIVWSVCGTSWATSEEITTGGTTTTRLFDGTVAFAGTSFTFSPTCAPPGVATTMFGYDATPTTLALYTYGYGAGTVRVDSFVLE
jgi:hypothetical protein